VIWNWSCQIRSLETCEHLVLVEETGFGCLHPFLWNGTNVFALNSQSFFGTSDVLDQPPVFRTANNHSSHAIVFRVLFQSVYTNISARGKVHGIIGERKPGIQGEIEVA
jgi:hypothetical protein